MSHPIDVNEGWKPKSVPQVLAIFFVPLALFIVVWLVINSVWFATSSTGTVRDEQGKPIAGAVVFASWQTRDNMTAGREFLHGEESVSDAEGNFVISWWGPRIAVRPMSQMPGSEPELWVVRRGFVPSSVGSATDSLDGGSRTVNATIKPEHVEVVLRRLDARTERFLLLDILRRPRWRAYGANSPERCLWEKFPSFTTVFEQIEQDVGTQEGHLCPWYAQ